jgi:Tol biopolymer transport system component
MVASVRTAVALVLAAAAVGTVTASPPVRTQVSLDLATGMRSVVVPPPGVSWVGHGVYLTAGNGAPARELAEAPQDVASAVWSPDRRAVAYWFVDTSACAADAPPPCRRAELWAVNSDGTGLGKLADDAVDPAWSPDSRRLAFVGDYDVHAQTGIVSVASVDGGARLRLTGRESARDPRWSPDGRTIAYTRTNARGYRGYVRLVPANGSARARSVARGYDPEWSPAGGSLAFVGADRRTALFVAELSPLRIRRIASVGALGEVAWSPGGGRLAFATGGGSCGTGAEIHVVRADGSPVRTSRTAPSTSVAGLAWAPGGDAVTYSQVLGGGLPTACPDVPLAAG